MLNFGEMSVSCEVAFVDGLLFAISANDTYSFTEKLGFNLYFCDCSRNSNSRFGASAEVVFYGMRCLNCTCKVTCIY